MEWFIAVIVVAAITAAVMNGSIEQLNRINPPSEEERRKRNERKARTETFALVVLVAAILIIISAN